MNRKTREKILPWKANNAIVGSFIFCSGGPLNGSYIRDVYGDSLFLVELIYERRNLKRIISKD